LKPGPTGDYVLSVGRLEGNKRVDLIVRALAHAGPRVRLVVVGEGPLRAGLEKTAEELRVGDRVTFTGGVSEQQLVDLYAGALAVLFPPFDEDYGYVTLEAFLARKAVITTTDAGGPLEFVEDDVTGLVCDPTPEALGSAIARLAANPNAAASLGQAGHERASAITWDGVVDRLMAEG
jgi:glycosyltransferase involved in cell wall biosynthesis